MGDIDIELGVAQVFIIGQRALDEVGEHRVGKHLVPVEIAEGIGLRCLLESLCILVDDSTVDLLGAVSGVYPAAAERAHAQ